MLIPVTAISSASLEAAPFPADHDRRVAALQAALASAAPTAESEEWRYSPIGELDLSVYSPVLAQPVGMEPPTIVDSGQADVVARITIIDGWVGSIEHGPMWPSKGLTIETSGERSAQSPAHPEADQIDLLHQALAPGSLRITVAPGVTVPGSVIIRSHHTAGSRAAFPHVEVAVGSDAEVSIIEYQTSDDGPGLSVPLLELHAADAARLRYVTVQELGSALWQLARQVSTVGNQASLVSGIAAFGGEYARVRTDTRLTGQGASGDLIAIYYADGDQVHDFRTFQHHDAPNTLSDLLFKGTIDDTAGSIYTGLIHIHPDGRGSNAHQTNRNVKLSEDAWAWSTPNLEIENNEVRCSHASTVSPIDEEQQFYLNARGVPPVIADRLIVAGFFSEVLERFPGAGIRSEVERLVAEKLDRRAESVPVGASR